MAKILAERLTIPNEREGLDPLEIEGSRFSFFKKLFGRSGKMAKINLLAILFALPAIVWFVYTFLVRKAFQQAINYSGNIGLGYSIAENTTQTGYANNFYASLLHYAVLIPLIAVAFIGLGGAFFAMRKMAQGDERVAKNFFKGVRLTFADFILHGILAGVAIFIIAINFTIYDAYGTHVAFKIVGIISAFIFALVTLCYLVYACTHSATYKVGLPTIIKNSVLFAVKLPVQTIFMSLIGAVPIIVLYFALPGLFLNAGDIIATLVTTIAVSLFFFLGLSLVASAWTVYTNYVYELGFGARKTVKHVNNEAKNTKKKGQKT